LIETIFSPLIKTKERRDQRERREEWEKMGRK
jgi:hypothetical protein